MRLASIWREWESGDSLPLSLLRMVVLFCGLLFLGFTAFVGLPWPQQTLVALLTVGAAVWLDRTSTSYVVTLTLVLLSVYSTFRYGIWRVVTTAAVARDAGSAWSMVEAFLMLLLLGAECYAITVLVLGYMQTVWPLRRTPVPLPDNTAEWPAVDVLIPTLNEPLDVVRFTVLAALNMDWPAEKLNVYLLDDGRRPEFRDFARQAGAGYMTRDENQHGKAGNLNAALAQVDSPFVVVFDADHVPTRSFLQVTMGWFVRDAQLGILQTPHHFYSPDPFERNLGQFRAIPNEDELFYGVVQDGNDFWNAAYFCGSCAVLRRTALDQVGWLATDTVTEDAHTSMRMQRLGWNSAYINIPQAAGLATARLSAHVRQRIRWARGMVQILRMENPMFGPGLTFAQRLCYLNAMSHFLYALPRLIFLTSPLVYLVFGFTNIPGYWATILAYAAPHLVLSRVARSRMQGRHRHSFWTDIFETVLAPYLVLPTLGALFRPRRGRLQAAPSGEAVETDHFDSRMATPTLVLLACNWFGLCCAAPRWIQFPSWQVPDWASAVNWPATLYDPGHTGTIALNVAWTLFNLVLLGVALGVAWESRQRRRSVRVETHVPAEVVLRDGSIVRGVTADLSSGGVRTTMEYDVAVERGDHVDFVFPVLDGTATLPGTVVSLDGRTLRARFDRLTLEQYEALTMILYARADRWLGWGEARKPDRPLASFVRVLRLALWGLKQAFFGPAWSREEDAPRRPWATSVVPVLVFGVLFGLGGRAAAGAQGNAPVDALAALAKQRTTPQPALKPVASATPYQSTFSLAQAGASESVILRGSVSRANARFPLPDGLMVKSAVLHLRYRFSSHLLPGASSLRITLNGTSVASLPVIAPPEVGGAGGLIRTKMAPGSRLESLRPGDTAPVLESSIVLPANVLGRNNQLGFDFVGHVANHCENPGDPALWGRVEAESWVEISGSRLPLEDELGLLPAPFLNAASAGTATAQIAFLRQPSLEGMRAAAIIASWLGSGAGERPLRFSVSVGTIPAGNVIVLAESRAALPAELNLPGAGGFAAMRTNPEDASAKILVLGGATGEELARAAADLTRRRGLRGAQVSLAYTEDDGSERGGASVEHLQESRAFANAETGNLDGDGSQPAQVRMRLPPDLFLQAKDVLGGERVAPLHLRYHYDGATAGGGSTLEVWANGAFVRAIPLAHSGPGGTSDEAVVPIPAGMLRVGANTLTLRFAFEPVLSGGCAVAGSGGFRGSIGKDSYLDLTGIPRWAELPDLKLFADAGFPLTRQSDFRGTTAILPEQPSVEELRLFLGLMARLGGQSGASATGLSVATSNSLDLARGRDLLVLGTVRDIPLLHSSGFALPATMDETGLHGGSKQGLFGLAHVWGRMRGQPEAADLAPASPPDAVIEESEWPANSGHALIVVTLRDDSAAGGLLPALATGADAGAVSDDLAVLRDGSFRSSRISGGAFSVGHLSVVSRLEIAITQFPWLVAAASVLFSFLTASLLRTALRRSARVRLQGNY